MPVKRKTKTKSKTTTKTTTKASRSKAAKKAWRTRKRIYGKSGTKFGSRLQPSFELMGPWASYHY